MKSFFYNSLTLYFCFLQFHVWATHIVGGEFQLTHIQDFEYQLKLNLYFDNINGNPEAEDADITAYIYSKKTNTLLGNVFLPKTSEQDVSYTNPECTSSFLETRLLVYSNGLVLDPGTFNEEEGYYVIWERCCRNNSIVNIQRAGDTGMTFYLEFPPVVLNGSELINSSPVFTIPKGDYLCLDTPFTIDFGATDPDGDELVYSFDTPLAGHSRSFDPFIIPEAFSAPYDPAVWETGFSAGDAISSDASQANHAFTINSGGLISVTPDQLGLFVFSALCEEYRVIGGIRTKIGEVRRDYQLMVIDCPTNDAPTIGAEYVDDTGNTVPYNDGDVILIDPNSGNLCFTVNLNDINVPEVLNVELVPKNFTPRQSLLSTNRVTVNDFDRGASVQVCWSECLGSEKDDAGNFIPFEFDLVVGDNSCPASEEDLVSIRLVSIPVENNPPTALTNAPVDRTQTYDYSLEGNVGTTFTFDVFGRDMIDADLLSLVAVGRDFNLEEYGMEFEAVSGQGAVSSTFTWNSACNAVVDDITRFVIDFVAEDNGVCESKQAIVTVELIMNDIPVDLDAFLPTNIFTPNGDGNNDIFKMSNHLENSFNLPQENCRFQFKKIEIFNRWGAKVFESEDRNFEWDGADLPSGTFFYRIDYLNKIFKGTVSLMR